MQKHARFIDDYIVVGINGQNYDGFKSYSISRALDNVSGQFSLTLSNPKGGLGFPWDNTTLRPGQLVQIVIISKFPDSKNPSKIILKDYPILNGYIEFVESTYSEDNHEVTIAGRDKVCDLIDSTLGSDIEFIAPVTLQYVLQTIIEKLGLGSAIKVIDNIGNIEPFTEREIISGQLDETIFQFLEKYTRKRQVLLNTDGKGNLTIERIGSKSLIIDPNILITPKSSTLRFDFSQRFNSYRVVSQDNLSSGGSIYGSEVSASEKIISAEATIIDDEIRSSRKLDITAESACDFETLQRRAAWECSVRKARAIEYHTSVFGHTASKSIGPWVPNMMIHVQDPRQLIDTDMLIKEVDYSLDLDGGSVTNLVLVDKNSYSPEIAIKSDKKLGRKNKNSNQLGTPP